MRSAIPFPLPGGLPGPSVLFLALSAALCVPVPPASAEDGTVLPRGVPPVDDAGVAVDAFRFLEDFEGDPVSGTLAGGAVPTTTGGEVLDGARSLRLPPGGSLTLDPASLPIESGKTYRFLFRTRLLGAAPSGSSLTVEAVWDGGTHDLGALADGVADPDGSRFHLFRFGAVTQPTFRVTATPGATVVIDSVIVQERMVRKEASAITPLAMGYPRLAKVGWGSIPAMAEESGQRMTPFLELLSRFHLVTGFEADPTLGNDWVPDIRAFSPDLLLVPSVQTFSATSGAPPAGGAAGFDALFDGAIPAQWTLVGPDGSPVTAPGDPDARFLNPTPSGGLVGGERLGEVAGSLFDEILSGSGLFDGVHLERFGPLPDAAAIVPGGAVPDLPPLDLEGDGFAEPLADIRDGWRVGFEDYQEDLRNRLGSAALILGDGGETGQLPGKSGALNGWRTVRAAPYPVLPGGDWDTARASGWYDLLASYQHLSGQGSGLQVPVLQFSGSGLGSSSGTTPLGHPDRVGGPESRDFRRLRVGLATTLLGDGFFAYDLVDRTGPVLWFDEYSVGFDGSSMGDRFGRSYLGQPLAAAGELPRPGAATPLAIDFETGVPAGVTVDGTLGTDPSEVLEGSRSLVVTRAPGASPTPFLTVDPGVLGLAPGDAAELLIDYRILSHAPETYGPVLEAGFDATGTMAGENARVAGTEAFPGREGRLRASILVTSAGQTVTASLGDVASVAVDRIRVVRNGGGAWRRDFENGIVLVNPTPLPLTLAQAEVAGPLGRVNIRRILGTQDPSWNDGSAVTAGLTLPPGEAVILLAERLAGELPDTPTGLAGTADEETLSLAWDPPTGVVAGYLVEVAEGNGSFTDSHLARPVPAVTLTGLPSGTPHRIRVTALDYENRRSTPSEVLSISTSGAPATRPSVVGFNQPELRPGELLTALVSGLSVAGETNASEPFPTVLDGVSVLVNGEPALMVSVSPGAVGFILPETVQPGGDAIVRLRDGGTTGPGYRLHVRDPAVVAVGAVTSTTVGTDAVDFSLEGGAVARVELVDEDILRIRLNPAGALTSRVTGAIAPDAPDAPGATITDSPDLVALESSALRVLVSKAPFRVRVERPDGTLIAEDGATAVEWNSATGTISSYQTAAAGQPYFGLGLRGGPLDRRGDTFTMRNTDRCCYGEFDGPLYTSIPFYYSRRNDGFYGVFHDNPSTASYDLDSANRGEIEYRAQRGELDYYLFAGPTPGDVLNGFSRLTGFSPLPPKWSLGYHQSRFGYQSAAEITGLANSFRSFGIPADALWLDLDWMNDLNILEWDPLTFPDPQAMRTTLQGLGFNFVNIVDLAVQPDDPLAPFFIANDLFLEDAAGNPVEETLFAPFNDIYWLDITNPDTADWYVDNLSGFLTDYRPGGIWNDLNEIASNSLPTAVYDFGGDPRGDLEARNIFALRELALTREAWEQALPDERPFLLSRSGFPGIQRYAGLWSGDTLTSFDSMRVSVQTSIHMGISGNNVFGHDIGGFLGNPGPELFLRWLAFGGYTTFYRNHTLNTTAPKEPWAFGEPYTSMAREIISQRYRILPYLYSLHELAAREADPVLAPTFFHFPDDPLVYGQDSEYMLGPSLLVAPVFTAGATERTLYLPAGADWYELGTDRKFAGGQEVTVDAPLDHIPVFVRAGSILPFSPVRQHVNEVLPDDRITFHVYPGPVHGPALYEDDGLSDAHEGGDFLRTTLQRTTDPYRDEFTFQREGSYEPAPRSTWLEVHDYPEAPVAVVIDGSIYPATGSVAELEGLEAGWHFAAADEMLHVRAGRDVGSVAVLRSPGLAEGTIPHIFYFDLDGDLQGDPRNAVVLPSEERIPGLVLVGNDPDDSDPTITEARLGRGSRLVGYNLLSTPQNPSIDPQLLRDAGIEVGAVGVQWDGLESAPGTFDGPQNGTIGLLNSLLPARNWQLDLAVGPVEDTGLRVPADLAGDGLSSPALASRFNALLDHLHASLPGIPVHTLRLGRNVDLYFATETDPAARAAYLAWLQDAVAHARTLWGPGLQVSLTVTAEGLLAAGPDDYLLSLLDEVDVVGVSYQPGLGADLAAPMPWAIGSELDRLVEVVAGKPLQLVEVAFPGSRQIGSSPTRQVQFVNELFRAWDRHREVVPYLSFGPFFDRSPTAAATEAQKPRYGATPENTAALETLLASQGLRHFPGEGAAKPAYHTLRNELFDRGWWLTPARTSRSFLLGMGADPNDLIPGNLDPSEPFIDSVMDELFALIDNHADLVGFQFDNGVPWVEAETDDFGSAELPYSENVRATWDGLRSRANPGQFTAVSINPLGRPRARPASYWGMGEGFYIDLNGERVPNGIMQDYNRRLPPGEWANRDLDDPLLRQAYLNYAKRAITYFRPDYLVLGIEVNETLDEGQAYADEYIAFQKFLYESLKADPECADTPLVASISAEFLMRDELGFGYLLKVRENPILYEAHRDFVEDLLPWVDVLGLSLHPIKLRLPGETLPVAGFARLINDLRSLTTKPLAFTEADFPARSFDIFGTPYEASAAKQERFFRMLVEEMERDGNFAFLIQYVVKDFTPRLDRLRARAQEDPPYISPFLVEFFKIFEFTGLFDDDGTARPVLTTWLDRFLLPVEGDFSAPVVIASPHGSVEAEVFVEDSGSLAYRVRVNGGEVLLPSPLGVTVDGVNLGAGAINVRLGEVTEVDESYPLLSSRSTARNHYREAVLAVRRAGDLELAFEMIFRVYDDGVAYRYRIPAARLGAPLAPRTASGEASGWVVPEGSIVWHHDQTENYEGDFRSLEVGYFDVNVAGQLTVELPGDPPVGYLFISEADLNDYPGMTLQGQFLSGLLQASFLDDTDWEVVPDQLTPWRFIMTASSLDGLVASDLVPNLNEGPDPVLFPDGPATDWIKPGKALWSWWADENSAADFEAQKAYIDAAHELGLEFVTIDIYWELGFPAGGKDQFERLAELVTYAKSDGRDIDLWVWKNWFEILDQTERRQFLQDVKDAGAVGVKVDLVFGNSSEAQVNVRLQEEILRDASERQLMVNLHGTGKAHGNFRSYPNLLGYEGARGLENATAIFQTNPESLVTPEHNAVLVFTRLLAGPMDYTPVTFDAQKAGDTTFTHQLALAGLMHSPLLHLADTPANLQAQTTVLDLLTALPTTWDETLAVGPNKIGDFAMLARRKGSEWWLFGINGDAGTARVINGLELGFLEEGVYGMSLVGDETATSFARTDGQLVTGTSTLDLNLLGGGGVVARFQPAAALDYATWAALTMPDDPELRDPLLDPDEDGLINLFEMALGGDPLGFDSGLLPAGAVVTDGGEDFLEFTFRHRADPAGVAVGTPGIEFTLGDLSYRVERSGDLQGWNPVTGIATTAGPPQDNGDGTVTVRVRIPLSALPPGGPQFVRLHVSLVP